MFFLSSIKCLDYNHHIHVQVTSNYRSNQNLITLNDDMAMNFSFQIKVTISQILILIYRELFNDYKFSEKLCFSFKRCFELCCS